MPHLSRYVPGEVGIWKRFSRSRFVVSALGDSHNNVAIEDIANSEEGSAK